MKKNYFLCALMLLSTMAFAQKALILNGGQYGNPQENVNLLIYDIPSGQYSQIDTVFTESIQELIIDGEYVYIAAQDSIVKYDLSNESRVAAAEFLGMSTKDLEIVGNELWVSNFYGQTTNNIYVYNKNDLSFVDSLVDVTRAVGSMASDGTYLYATQNSSTASYTDTLGMILKIDVATKTIVDTIEFTNYTDGVGQLLIHDGNLVCINSSSIGTLDLSNDQQALHTYSNYFGVGSKSGYSIHADTIFLITDRDIAAIDLSDYSIISTDLLDTVVNAFSYDTLNHNFYITQTDFSTYTQGAIYGRDGQKVDSLKVGFSPEAVRIYYDINVGIVANNKVVETKEFKVFPNPASDRIQFAMDEFESSIEMRIFNQVGAVVKTQYITSNDVVDVSGLSRGVYFVMLNSKDNYGIQKLIIR